MGARQRRWGERVKGERSDPLYIHGDNGEWVLADTEEQAREWAAEYEPNYVLTPAGWMQNVGWDRDSYERKRDFEAETGFSSWWEGCPPPADEQPTKNCRRAFEVNYGAETVAKKERDDH
jgi:hypothetical protein